MRIVGLEKRYGQETLGAIPTLWNRFVEIESAIAGRVDAFSYGVCRGGLEEHVVYLAGVEVRADHAVPADLDTVEVPPARYAVVPHRGHVAELRGLWRWILETWLPQSGLRLAPQPDLERYGPGFDPDTGMGDIEVWVPVERAAGHAH